MLNYAKILGREPTDEERKVLEFVEGIFNDLRREHPDLSINEIGTIMQEWFDEGLAERERRKRAEG